jgi:hypothetical protein
MENRLSSLLEKYWEGETTLEEEREIKNLLQNAEGFEEEKKFFLGIGIVSTIQANEFELKNKKLSSDEDFKTFGSMSKVMMTMSHRRFDS